MPTNLHESSLVLTGVATYQTLPTAERTAKFLIYPGGETMNDRPTMI